MPFIRFTYLCFLFAISPAFSQVAHEDFYTSISGMESLLQLEYHLLDNLKDYVDRELTKHQQINSVLEDFENENTKAEHNPDKYFSSPINVFRTIKRSVVDFKDLKNVILDRSNEEQYNVNVTRIESDLGLHVATEDDLKGAVLGLVRLQTTYKLNASDLAEGRIMGVQYSAPMSASDSYQMGYQLYEAEQYNNSFEWYSDTRQRIDSQTDDDWDFIDDALFYEKYSSAAYASGNLKLAHNLTLELIRIHPTSPYAYENLKIVEMDLFYERNTPKRRRKEKKVEPTMSEKYEATCRGELQRTPTEERPLRCMYVTNNVPFLKIAPLKLEQLSFDPFMVYYHEVIYQNEIDKVLETAESKIFRSKIGDKANSVVSTVRTSKNAWLNIDDYEFLANLEQRIVDMTELSLETAEQLQVANYGIGGHYGPHTDFHPDPIIAFGEGMGNRFATALFYISDVDLGGATAFPVLKMAVKPIKRSLVLWYNLHNSTDPDFRTIHAGCPVLKGSKWILNQWIHERGQEFLRPCGLESTTHLSAEYTHQSIFDELYEATCRGEAHQTPTEQRPLRCMYVTNNVPFLKIAPYKMEQLSLDPLMVRYHDMVHDREIEQILQMTAPHIFRSRIVDEFNQSHVISARTSKNSWLQFEEHDFLQNLKQRLFDVTQMTLTTAGRVQVANYGIGGHYGPHFDFHPVPDEVYGPQRGNRIATALFYISDVEHGGATAFPFLTLAVTPIRRSMVLWYNLHSSGEPDYRTNHAGCPVLKGSKWILTEWIHERGQEFVRPCELQSTGHLSNDYRSLFA